MPDKKPARITKTAFVRSQPNDLSAKEVVAKAKAAGLKLSEKYVYSIRYESKKASKKGKPVGAKPGPKPKAPSTARTRERRVDGIEDLLRAAAAEIGLSRAIAILQEQQETVRAVLRG